MNRLFILIRDIYFGGGGERVAVNLANYFVGAGYDVTIVTIAVPEKENIFSIDKRVRIENLRIDFKKGLNLVQKIRSIYAVRKYFSKDHKQGIVLGIGTYPNLLLSFVPTLANLRKIGCQHCSYASLNLKWRSFGKLFFGRLEALISLTEEDRMNWSKMNRNISVIPNAVSFYPNEAASLTNKIILSVGRIDYAKGFDILLKVFEKFTVANKEWKLRIIGDGTFKNRLIKNIKKCCLEDRVEILPPAKDILKVYLDSSVFVMTSRSEGLPMVLLEAKACGLPTISFDIKTGPSEIIHSGSDGFLISDFDIQQMTDKLLVLCSDASMRQTFGKNAREDVKRFLPDEVGKRWEALFSQLKVPPC